MNIGTAILQLAEYGLSTGLIEKEDKIYMVNQLMGLFGVDEIETVQKMPQASLPEILEVMLETAVKNGLCDGGIVSKDLFDTKIMGLLTPRPSEVIRTFRQYYSQSPQKATDWYYQFSQDTNYIRRDRMKKNMVWQTETPYGLLDITINLAKPEKDPKAIAAAKKARQSGYPKCQLCKENVGYAGRIDHPARQNHRVIPITINQSDWGFQYSPYTYYNEHCIAFNGEHIPMKIEKATFRKLFDFVIQFPHYFIGSNADLPVVGGSILTHDHFQGGRYVFAMEKAVLAEKIVFKGYENIKAGRLKWPMTAIRLTGRDDRELVELSDKILEVWQKYSDPSAFVYAFTGDTPHNTITPIARKAGEDFQIDLVLRNNKTTEHYPLGIFHPHPEYHHIKKENIGLIEVMGLAVLPARLKQELNLVEKGLLNNTDLRKDERTAKHADWADAIRKAHPELNAENVRAIVREETGHIFEKVLEDAGVFKCDETGARAFDRFIKAVNMR